MLQLELIDAYPNPEFLLLKFSDPGAKGILEIPGLIRFTLEKNAKTLNAYLNKMRIENIEISKRIQFILVLFTVIQTFCIYCHDAGADDTRKRKRAEGGTSNTLAEENSPEKVKQFLSEKKANPPALPPVVTRSMRREGTPTRDCRPSHETLVQQCYETGEVVPIEDSKIGTFRHLNLMRSNGTPYGFLPENIAPGIQIVRGGDFHSLQKALFVAVNLMRNQGKLVSDYSVPEIRKALQRDVSGLSQEKKFDETQILLNIPEKYFHLMPQAYQILVQNKDRIQFPFELKNGFPSEALFLDWTRSNYKQPGRQVAHIDHILPKSHSGPNHPKNAAVISAGCNMKKSDTEVNEVRSQYFPRPHDPENCSELCPSDCKERKPAPRPSPRKLDFN